MNLDRNETGISAKIVLVGNEVDVEVKVEVILSFDQRKAL